jgi:hypothetical protein
MPVAFKIGKCKKVRMMEYMIDISMDLKKCLKQTVILDYKSSMLISLRYKKFSNMINHKLNKISMKLTWNNS